MLLPGPVFALALDVPSTCHARSPAHFTCLTPSDPDLSPLPRSLLWLLLSVLLHYVPVAPGFASDLTSTAIFCDSGLSPQIDGEVPGDRCCVFYIFVTLGADTSQRSLLKERTHEEYTFAPCSHNYMTFLKAERTPILIFFGFLVLSSSTWYTAGLN